MLWCIEANMCMDPAEGATSSVTSDSSRQRKHARYTRFASAAGDTNSYFLSEMYVYVCIARLQLAARYARGKPHPRLKAFGTSAGFSTTRG